MVCEPKFACLGKKPFCFDHFAPATHIFYLPLNSPKWPETYLELSAIEKDNNNNKTKNKTKQKKIHHLGKEFRKIFQSYKNIHALWPSNLTLGNTVQWKSTIYKNI